MLKEHKNRMISVPKPSGVAVNFQIYFQSRLLSFQGKNNTFKEQFGSQKGVQ